MSKPRPRRGLLDVSVIDGDPGTSDRPTTTTVEPAHSDNGTTTLAPPVALPLIYSAPMLKKNPPPDPKWAIEGLLPEGFCLLAGKSKLGKSWAALSIALSVSFGGFALGSKQFPCAEGEVLYLALEDTPRRMLSRLNILTPEKDPTELLHFTHEWLTIDRGGVAQLEQWMKGHPKTRLVIIDTLNKLRPKSKGNGNQYDEDYSFTSELQKIGQRYHVCILAVHHTRKSEADDPFDTISGTVGNIAAADGLYVLQKTDKHAGKLHAKGRDFDEQSYAMRFERGQWTILGESEATGDTRAENEILDILRDARRPITVGDIAVIRFGKESKSSRESTRKILARLNETGKVNREYRNGQALFRVAAQAFQNSGKSAAEWLGIEKSRADIDG